MCRGALGLRVPGYNVGLSLLLPHNVNSRMIVIILEQLCGNKCAVVQFVIMMIVVHRKVREEEMRI